MERDYPAIAARARAEGAVVLWLDQTGIRSDAATARTWAPKGETPVVGKTGTRFGVNAMCAISNTGQMYFTVYTGSFNAGVFIPFLDRLIQHLDRKVHPIVHGHPVHRRKTVQQWVADHGQAIEMHFLPGYSPNSSVRSAPSSTDCKNNPTGSAPTSANPKSATPPDITCLPYRSI